MTPRRFADLWKYSVQYSLKRGSDSLLTISKSTPADLQAQFLNAHFDHVRTTNKDRFRQSSVTSSQWHAERASSPSGRTTLRRFASTGENRLHKQVGFVNELCQLVDADVEISNRTSPLHRRFRHRRTILTIAAFATAGTILTIKRGSNGFGMMYSGPSSDRSPYAEATTSLCSAWASSAIARTAASFISSLMAVAPTSAPRKINGKQGRCSLVRVVGTAGTNDGIGRTSFASGGNFRFGFASAGSLAGPFLHHFWVSTFGPEQPENIAPSITSSRVRLPSSTTAYAARFPPCLAHGPDR